MDGIESRKKKITLSVVIRYLGVFFLFLGIGGLLEGDILPAMFIILIGLLLTPEIATPIEKKLNVSLSAPIRVVIVFCLFLGFGITANLAEHAIDSPAADSSKETIAAAPQQAAAAIVTNKYGLTESQWNKYHQDQLGWGSKTWAYQAQSIGCGQTTLMVWVRALSQVAHMMVELLYLLILL